MKKLFLLALIGLVSFSISAQDIKKFEKKLAKRFLKGDSFHYYPVDRFPLYNEYMEIVADRHPGIENIRIYSKVEREFDWNVLSKFKNLKRLDVRTGGISLAKIDSTLGGLEELTFLGVTNLDISVPHLRKLTLSGRPESKTDSIAGNLTNLKIGKIDTLEFQWGMANCPSFSELNVENMILKPRVLESGYGKSFELPMSLKSLVFDYSGFTGYLQLQSTVFLKLSTYVVTKIGDDISEYSLERLEFKLGVSVSDPTFSEIYNDTWSKPKDTPGWENVKFVLTEIKTRF